MTELWQDSIVIDISALRKQLLDAWTSQVVGDSGYAKQKKGYTDMRSFHKDWHIITINVPDFCPVMITLTFFFLLIYSHRFDTDSGRTRFCLCINPDRAVFQQNVNLRARTLLPG